MLSGLNRISTFSHSSSLLVWLALQLIVLLLPVMQVQLSDEFPRPAESLAADEMIVAQVALSALLSSFLMRDLAATAVMAATTWPFLLLAGLLSSTPPNRVVEAGAFISLWIIALGLLQAESRKCNVWTAAMASTIAIGGAIAAYLRSEFSSGRVDGLLFGPIVGALDLLHETENRWRSWIFLLFFLIAGGAARIVSHRLHTSSRQVIHNFGG